MIQTYKNVVYHKHIQLGEVKKLVYDKASRNINIRIHHDMAKPYGDCQCVTLANAMKNGIHEASKRCEAQKCLSLIFPKEITNIIGEYIYHHTINYAKQGIINRMPTIMTNIHLDWKRVSERLREIKYIKRRGTRLGHTTGDYDVETTQLKKDSYEIRKNHHHTIGTLFDILC